MTSDPSNSLDPNPPFFDLVSQMRAMRRLKPDPVPLELLRKVLDAGVQAPSGMNSQPWKFLVLSERPDVRWFADHYREAIEARFGDVARSIPDDADSPAIR
jgi:nitroreductase